MSEMIIVVHFPFELFIFFYLYIVLEMSGSSDAIAHEFMFFCVFLLFSQCLTYRTQFCM